ncbi:unnamed protein product [Litomosoides sigmodontis]|uniref:Uncharacterized protein n=1 Tax=Litomosoides sigmodontis TaxID=42156 RepID=A0A3P6SN36_LITSI|nr:unnamed protein product [Litomosoides sigmodontis]
MQRTRIRLEEEAKRKNEQKLQKRFLKKDEKKLLRESEEATEPAVKSENRYDLLENLSFGRLSFKGFNPEVEKLMKYYQDMKGDEVVDEVGFGSGQDVTDCELATSIFSAKAQRRGKYQKHEMNKKNSTDEINEQPTKRKRKNDRR